MLKTKTVDKKHTAPVTTADEAKKTPSRKSGNTDPAKQPSFAEQEEALKPRSGAKPAKAVDASFRVTQVRLLDKGFAEADLVASFFGPDSPYKAISTKTVTIRFKKAQDDFDSGGNLFDAFEAAGHLTGTGLTEDIIGGDIYPALVKAGAMALRDDHVTKDYRGVAANKIPKPGKKKKSNKPELQAGGGQTVTQVRVLAGGKAEVDFSLELRVNGTLQPAKEYTVKFDMSPEGNYLSARNAYIAFVAAGHLDGFEFEREEGQVWGPIWSQVTHAISDALGDPARRKQL